MLSPTLFIVCTRDMPTSLTGINISYADDITQIIPYSGKSKEILRRRSQREIENINHFKKLWRIKTNVNKFNILRPGALAGNEIIIKGEPVAFQNEGKTLGLLITRTGYCNHINKRIVLVKQKMQKLYRFRNMPNKTKTHLIKSLIIPLLDYLPIPIHTMSIQVALINTR